jgi:hypothetical protein
MARQPSPVGRDHRSTISLWATLTNTIVAAQISGSDVNGELAPASSNNLIGGTAAGSRNVVSHNPTAGIQIGGGASGNLIRGNYVGTNPGANIS